MSETKSGLNPAVVNGGALIIVGVLLLLDQLNIVDLDFWALVLFVVGLLKLLQSSNTSGRLWGLFPLVAGIGLELEHLGRLHLHLDRTWPVFVIAAGLVLIWRAYRQETPKVSGGLSPQLNVFAVWGGGEYRIRAKDFRGGSLVAFMGGFDVDLREADIEGDEAVIDV